VWARLATLVLVAVALVPTLGGSPATAIAAATSQAAAGLGLRATAGDRIAAGGDHQCAIDAGDVRCWGSGADGQLGYGSTVDVADPASAGVVDIGGTAIAIAAGTAHTCVLRSDGRVLCWGSGADGRLGYGNTQNIGDDETPASVGAVDLGRLAIGITAGDKHTCALLNNGAVRCWGDGANGRLGNGTGTKDIGDDETPASMPGVNFGGEAIAVDAGGRDTCALISTGEVRCWGLSYLHIAQIEACDIDPSWCSDDGIGDDEDPVAKGTMVIPQPAGEHAEAGGLRAAAISVGDLHACALLDNGQVACWGRGRSGEFGNDVRTAVDALHDPAAIADLDDKRAISVSAGNGFTCAVLSGGATRCWGRAGAQLGNTASGDVLDPMSVPAVANGANALAVSAGTSRTCALLATGDVRCWGVGGAATLHTRVHVAQMAQGRTHTCLLMSDGSVHCWGANDRGQLGLATTSPVDAGAADTGESLVDLGGRARSIAAGSYHTCAVMDSGALRCWGAGSSGQLGLGNVHDVGDDEHPSSASNVALARPVIAVTAGDQHTCAVLDTGEISCWGRGSEGQLGYGNTAWLGNTQATRPSSVNPMLMYDAHRARAVSAGYQHTCALLSNGRVQCWGRGESGQLGYASTARLGDDSGEQVSGGAPVQLGSGREVRAVSAGDNHTCAILDDGNVRCWGLGTDGRLGYGNTASIGDDEQPSSAGPVSLGGRVAVAIATGAAHTCVIMDDGGLRCWGRGIEGQLGYGNKANLGDTAVPSVLNPVQIDGPVTGVAAGGPRTCAGTGDGALRCWGNGDPTPRVVIAAAPREQPQEPIVTDDPTPSSKVVQVAAGNQHTCALSESGDVYCWGNGSYGRLGYGDTLNRGDTAPLTNEAVPLGEPAVSIGAGWEHTCALLESGAVRCWGRNDVGQLGYGYAGNIGDNETPDQVDPVPLGGPAVAIAVGSVHTCAILEDGGVRCWGNAGSGRLGYGHSTGNIGITQTPASMPELDLGGGAVELSAGSAQTCAILADGSVRCWGAGSFGRLGYGNTDDVGDDESPASVGAVDLGAGRTAVSIATASVAPGGHTCAILDDASVRCWGRNNAGQLGYGNTSTAPQVESPAALGAVPVRSVGDGSAVISAGAAHTCVVTQGFEGRPGPVQCWGSGANGRLGNGSTASIGDDENADQIGWVYTGKASIDIAAGGAHTCTVTSDHEVYCWGDNSYGQLGYGNTTPVGNTASTLPSAVGAVQFGPVEPVDDTPAPAPEQKTTCQGQAATILVPDGQYDVKGTTGNDVVVANGGRHHIDALAGDDLICTYGSDDVVVEGNAGNDRIFTGAGDDALYGDLANGSIGYDGGDDELHGGAGNDTIEAGWGSDRVYGDAGADLLHGDGGDDALHGGDGNDMLYGEVGSDHMYGDAGSDVMYGAGDDRAFGAPVNDYDDSHGSTDYADGGTGIDDACFSTAPAHRTNCSQTPTCGGEHATVFAGPGEVQSLDGDMVLGTDGADVIVVVGGGHYIKARNGNDRICAYGDERNRVYGDDGNDLIITGNGDDDIDGGDGADVIYSQGGHDRVDGGDGSDYLRSGTGDDNLNGGAGNDQIWAEDGDDRLYGGSGNDALYGQDGDDRILGGIGRDRAYGGDGWDHCSDVVSKSSCGLTAS
jgi:alpha-tubulin suppressor-like RCC1 family protein